MWIEWTLGRYGGGFEHGTAPGIFHTIWQKNRFIKYFGVIGIFGPLVIFIYYTYIESWTLGYSFLSILGKCSQAATQEQMKDMLGNYQGLKNTGLFNGSVIGITFFLITFALNIFVISYGIKGGIEKLCKIAMPILFLCGLIIVIRVLTLGTPNPLKPDWNIVNGLGYMWNPDLSALKNPKVWLAAAGQIFFTLSVGIGVILTYASYLSKGDDVVLSGLSAVSTNELAEVILGGSIVIPAAFVFFGPTEIFDIAKSGLFNLGFVTMPLVLNQLPFSALLGFFWFFLLFLAGITSSVSLAQPAIAFLEDEFDISRKKAVMIFAILTFILCIPGIIFLSKGVIDELDFWGGTFCLVLFGTVETILFGWIFGIDKAWEEIHHGADLRIPKIYKFIIKYVTPTFLLFILGWWFIKEWLPLIMMKGVASENLIYILATRITLLVLFAFIAFLVRYAWKQRGITKKGAIA